LKLLKNKNKKIAGYGASGRGTIITNYCGLDNELLDYVIDDAPAKQGAYMPGVHLPIESSSQLSGKNRPDYILLFAWSFANEILKKNTHYVKSGGKFIVPLPKVKNIVNKKSFPNILVLGASGMVGQTIFSYLSKNYPMHIYGTARKSNHSLIFFDVSENNLSDLEERKYDYIINCIGILKNGDKEKMCSINSDFPKRWIDFA